jgi:hypothetical protein
MDIQKEVVVPKMATAFDNALRDGMHPAKAWGKAYDVCMAEIASAIEALPRYDPVNHRDSLMRADLVLRVVRGEQ